MKLRLTAAIFCAAPFVVLACASESAAPSSVADAGAVPSLDAATADDASDPNDVDPNDGDNPNPTNEVPIIVLPDGGTMPIDANVVVPPYATRVVSFTPGTCAGFGNAKMPNVVLGPPNGGGEAAGGTDVVSLGTGGEIILSFEPNVVVDGPGIDLLVLENPFFQNGASKPFAEIGEVSVSEDGITWKTFPCTATEHPWGACAGWHTVSKEHSSSLDPELVGGDPFDLADVGVARARFVRIVDKGTMSCRPGIKTNGFDLDAIAAVHSRRE